MIFINTISDYINKCFCIDNLKLMKDLPSDSIDLIYCDILYNTGKKFKDYDDKLGTPQEAMEWYKPRLIEMKRILKDTGSIYLQCDYRLVHYLKVEMDKIFGINNFRNEIIWWYKRWSNVSKNYQRMHDNILFYTKTKNYLFNIQYQGYSNVKSIETTVRKTIDGKLQRVKDEKGNYIKRKKKNLGVPLHDVWEIQHLQPTSKERIGYDTQKPKILLERIIKASSNESDIVADFFCGSGTTGVVAKELNRKYILCDINPKAIEISKERLKSI